jgi:CMP-2-keto-3-deoxyoctulosonic acid synthetase
MAYPIGLRAEGIALKVEALAGAVFSHDAAVVVNIQGNGPFIEPGMIDVIVAPFLDALYFS